MKKEKLEFYFSEEYLLKFGYFDFKYNSRKVNQDYLLSNLVSKEVFSTNLLYKNIESINRVIGFTSNKDTTPIELSIYKNDEERRLFKLPNLYSYIKLGNHLRSNKDFYIDVLLSSEKSLSNGFYSSSFLDGKIKREENRIGYRKVFKTDIQNFYPSIYTHSIPWLFVGKKEAKLKKNDHSLFYNELDTLIQKCQIGETHGIPTGSFVTRLIAEIYMCKFDVCNAK